MVPILLGHLAHHTHDPPHSLLLSVFRIYHALALVLLVGNLHIRLHHKLVPKLHNRPSLVLLSRLDVLDASLFLCHPSYP